MLIEDRESLRQFCARHRGRSPIGFDTEFVRERTYYPRLEIIQVVSEEAIDIIDCQAIDDLTSLWDLLCDPDTEKVVHAGKQDMELIFQESGRLPAPVFDTQIAASLLGLGSQCGYGRLVSTLLRKRVPKGETFSDWSRRPLHPDQLHYAEEDVRFLLDLHRVLYTRLEKRGRLRWLEEECSHLTDPQTFERLDPDNCFLRIKGRNSLDRVSLSVLRSLARWRELEARRRNLPPARIVKDHVLLSVAKSKPKSVEELKRQRGFGGGELARRGEQIIRVIEQGIEEAERSPVPTADSERFSSMGDSEGILKILGAVLQIQAEKASIAPSVLASSQDLRDFLAGYREHRLNGHPLLYGWRRELVGEMLLNVLEGKVRLRVDPQAVSLVIEQTE